MVPAYKKYLKKVKRMLCCSKADQSRLLNGLEQEIKDSFSDADNVTLPQLMRRFGPPEAVAAELQQALPDGAVAGTTKKRLHRAWLFFLVCLVSVALAAGYMIWQARQKEENTPPQIIVVEPPPKVIVVEPEPFISERPGEPHETEGAG